MANCTVIVRAYYGSSTSYAATFTMTLSSTSSYTVYGIYGAFINGSGFSPETSYVKTKGSNLLKVNGTSQTTYSSTVDPEDNDDAITFNSSKTGWISFYFDEITETFTQRVRVIDEDSSSVLDRGSFDAVDGDRYTTQSMMDEAGVDIPSGYEFVESTINGSTYYESLSERFYANEDYPTLYVYVRVPVTEMTLTVKYYFNGTLYDSDTCERTVGESYTIEECIEDAGISPSGEFIDASYHGTVYTDLDDEITIDDSYTTLKVYYQTETVTITLSLYLSGVLQSSANVTVNVGSTPTIASLIEDSEITVQSTWAFSSAVYNGTTYTSTSSTITAASGVTAMTLNYIVARTVTPYIFHNNSWREITATYIFTNGSWEECEPSLYIGGWK